jgi:cytochrome c oxidase subunit 2
VLAGLFGKPVNLNDGRVVIADENYIRESILSPQAKIVQGFGPIMPTFQGQVNEEDLLKLLAYVRSLGAERTTAPAVEPQRGGQAPPPVAPQNPKGTE